MFSRSLREASTDIKNKIHSEINIGGSNEQVQKKEQTEDTLRPHAGHTSCTAQCVWHMYSLVKAS